MAIDEVKKQLNESNDYISIAFTKKDGSTREMLATTNLALIPEKDHPKKTDDKDETIFQVKSDIVTVYEKDVGWRSFNFNNLTRFGRAHMLKADNIVVKNVKFGA